ncbi:sulfatase-like hydrolase/transferase [Bacteroides sp.]|uniref:sulfatase-like hydrolase/transferase n=1 Tax=Bacteroides sp. TaxID=29523 RepID=UPI002A82296F|nr:sulfatase-like hydrolase/transferase [Bacteroides sp.]
MKQIIQHSLNICYLPFIFTPLVTGCQPNTENTPKHPNLLFILTDDLQASSIHALGNNDVCTPAIDSLIAAGITFTNTYTNGALCGALSMPSRAMLMTGRGIYDIQADGMKIPETHTTFPQQFKRNGYRTFATGKWHSDKASFNRSFQEGDNIYFGGMHPYELNGHCSPHLNHYDSTGVYGKETEFTGKEFSSKMYADAAIRFLQRRKDEKQPFLAYVAFTSPHDPRNQLPAYGQKYAPDTLNLPANFLPRHPFDNGEMNVRDELLVPVPRTGGQIQKELSDYYGMISEVDVQIGRIMQALQETGQADNTIVVFASDNGLAMGRHGLLGKQNLYDHSVKVPLTLIAPAYKVQKGRKSNALCYLHDIAPTLCELANIALPESMRAQSLCHVLEDSTATHRSDLFLAYSNLQRGFVSGKYKYLIYNVGGTITEQLFDLQKDPSEQHNLLPGQEKTAHDLKEQLAFRMEEEKDFCNLSDSHWWQDGHKLTFEEMQHLYIYE